MRDFRTSQTRKSDNSATLNLRNNTNSTHANFLARWDNRPIVVELGNTGLSTDGEPTAELFLKSARRHPQWLHIGIDISDFQPDPALGVHQIKADFIDGLQTLVNESASVIISRFAVGYYSQSGQQADCLC